MSAEDMRRRRFIKGLVAVPVAPALAQAVQAPSAAPASQQQQPQPQPNTPARQVPRQPQQDVPQLQLTSLDIAADTRPHFFSAVQFASLQKLGTTLMPPLKNNPGALDAKAPEFIDFLIGASPAERQNSYRSGLDELEKQAKDKYQHSFAELEAAQVDAILRPLLTVRPWPEDLPVDPMKSFVAQVHEDLRTATMNSRQWAAASEEAGHRFTRGFRESGYYWFPIDPISQG